MFNSLVANDEGIVKIVEGSVCKVMGTKTVGYRQRWNGAYSGGSLVCPGGTVQSNIRGVLNEEGYKIQVQQGVITVSHEKSLILKRKKCGG